MTMLVGVYHASRGVAACSSLVLARILWSTYNILGTRNVPSEHWELLRYIMYKVIHGIPYWPFLHRP